MWFAWEWNPLYPHTQNISNLADDMTSRFLCIWGIQPLIDIYQRYIDDPNRDDIIVHLALAIKSFSRIEEIARDMILYKDILDILERILTHRETATRVEAVEALLNLTEHGCVRAAFVDHGIMVSW